ncbi:thioredoxin peroxidase [bacterium F11]|nr:thioredoxin peroxidase [bacterium F11]
MSIKPNEKVPSFSLEGILDGKQKRFQLSDFQKEWVVLFFYPADFTFVCPTEILGFEKRHKEFKDANANIIGISVDDTKSHLAWIKEIGEISYPLLSDTNRAISNKYGVLNLKENRAYRATFIISPEGMLAYSSISPMNVGRSVDDILRVLKALQTGRLCPADWKPGEETLNASLPD